MAYIRGIKLMKRFLIYIFILLTPVVNGQILTGVVSSSASSVSSSTLINGLLGGWKLDETSGNAVDVLGVYTGTSTAITYTASGKIGRCYTFNGTSSNVSFGNVLKPTNKFTISAWIKTTNTTGETTILDCKAYGSNWEGYQFFMNGTQVALTLYSNTATQLDYETKPTGAGTLGDGTWHHIVATWDGTNVYLYADNFKSAASPYSTTLVYNASNSLVMGNSPADAVWTTGDIDNVYIWNRALGTLGVDSLYTKENTGTTYPW
jgi:hypothetical protein